jgi:hypothetical protein
VCRVPTVFGINSTKYWGVLTETVSHFLLDCPRHTTLRQQLFFSLLDIPETISLNLLIFGSVNLNDEENKAVSKSIQTFIIKSKRFTP